MPSRLRVSSMDPIKTLASSGPSGEPMATPSICSYSCPLNWNSWYWVVALRRSTKVRSAEVQLVCFN